jgi:hypothetical protein
LAQLLGYECFSKRTKARLHLTRQPTPKAFTSKLPCPTFVRKDLLPPRNVPLVPNGHTSTRHTTRGVALQTGDEIKIETVADGGEKAPMDYVEIEPASR